MNMLRIAAARAVRTRAAEAAGSTSARAFALARQHNQLLQQLQQRSRVATTSHPRPPLASIITTRTQDSSNSSYSNSSRVSGPMANDARRADNPEGYAGNWGLSLT